jgi:ATP-binding cassette subfamily B protein
VRDFVENHVAHQDVKLLVRLLGYFKPYTGKFIGAFLLMIVTTFTNMVMPLASGLAIDLMVDPAYSLEQKVTVVFIGAAILLIITGLSILIGYFQSIMLQRIGQKITDQLRTEVFNHIESLSIGQINQLPVGKLVTRATNDPGNISEMFTNTIVNLIRNFLFMLVIAIIMFIIEWRMALITMAVVPSSLSLRFCSAAFQEAPTAASAISLGSQCLLIGKSVRNEDNAGF